MLERHLHCVLCSQSSVSMDEPVRNGGVERGSVAIGQEEFHAPR